MRLSLFASAFLYFLPVFFEKWAGSPLAKSSHSAFEPSGRELVLTLNNKDAVSAEGLGGMFSALAHDYRRITRGRRLVVGRISTGSIIAILWDHMAPYAHNATDLLKVVTGVSDLTKTLIATYEQFRAERVPLRAPLGSRSIEAIVKIAADSKCEVDLKYPVGGRSSLHLRVKPLEASQLRAKRQILLEEKRQLLPSRKQQRLLIGHIKNLPFQLATTSQAHAASLIEAFVAAFKGDELNQRLETLAQELEKIDRSEIAALVRSRIS